MTKTKEIVETDRCPYSEIAMLYAMKNPGKSLKTPLPEMVESAMESKGILSRWVSENYRSKKTHDITTNSVTISTIHSVKGLDYSAVFLLGLDYFGTSQLVCGADRAAYLCGHNKSPVSAIYPIHQ